MEAMQTHLASGLPEFAEDRLIKPIRLGHEVPARHEAMPLLDLQDQRDVLDSNRTLDIVGEDARKAPAVRPEVHERDPLGCGLAKEPTERVVLTLDQNRLDGPRRK